VTVIIRLMDSAVKQQRQRVTKRDDMKKLITICVMVLFAVGCKSTQLGNPVSVSTGKAVVVAPVKTIPPQKRIDY